MFFKRTELGGVPRGSAWALVTGAALGIGRQYAERLALLGYNLIMVDVLPRVAEEAAAIAETHNVVCVSRQLDLANTTAAYDLHAWTQSQGYAPRIVVNNAGIFSFCDFLQTPMERLERMLLLHDYTLTLICRLYADDMRQQGGGYLLNMSSYSVWMPFPGLATYSGSKAYVKSFTEAFAKELRGTGVSVTAICPAGVATDLYGLSKKLQAFGVKTGILMSPRSCARRGLRAMFKKRRSVVPDWWFCLLIPVCKYLPDFIVGWLRRFTMRWQS